MIRQRAVIDITVEAGAVVDVIVDTGAFVGLESDRGDKRRKRPRVRSPISDTTDPRTGEPYAGPIFAPDLSTGLPEFPSAQAALAHFSRNVGAEDLPLQLGNPQPIR